MCHDLNYRATLINNAILYAKENPVWLYNYSKQNNDIK